MKHLLICTIFLLLGLSTFAQGVDVLKLRKKRFFTETDVYTVDSSLTMLCEVCYDDPRSLDEEYCRSISLIVKDTVEFKRARIFSIKDDTAIIQCTYDRLSVWNWDRPSSRIAGMIKVLSRSSQFIELEMDIQVNANDVFYFRGKRKFIRSTNK